MNCYGCDQEAIARCARCGKAYCHDHGEAAATREPAPPYGGQALCADCLDPVSAAPSSAVFRASLFGLLVASVLALWLLVRPPSLPGEGSTVIQPRETAQPVFTPSGTKPAATAGAHTATPRDAASPQATATPAPEETPAAEETPEPPGPIEYVVQDGDTWYGIAGAYGVDADNLAAVNGLTIDDVIVPGQTLVIPQ